MIVATSYNCDQKMKKFYFVDETGKDIGAQIFIVSIISIAGEVEMFNRICLEHERVSAKNKRSWNDANPIKRLDYLSKVIEDHRFLSKLHYWGIAAPDKELYDIYTIQGIVRIVAANAQGTASEVYIDGLSHTEQSRYSKAIRDAGIKSARVHRANDDSFPLIRLADALAGLIRDAYETPNSDAAKLLIRGKRKNVVTENK